MPLSDVRYIPYIYDEKIPAKLMTSPPSTPSLSTAKLKNCKHFKQQNRRSIQDLAQNALEDHL